MSGSFLLFPTTLPLNSVVVREGGRREGRFGPVEPPRTRKRTLYTLLSLWECSSRRLHPALLSSLTTSLRR